MTSSSPLRDGTNTKRGRVVLAMSGGVDSSVAACLLKEQGYEVIGLFMRNGAHGNDLERRTKTCCSATDAVDAQAVADRLDIPFYALDFERDFARIMDQFADEYAIGRTPNPCIMCNIWLKFGKLWAYGKQVGADFVATGHYARKVIDNQGRHRIGRAVDLAKDQSYVLFGLRQELLPHVLLPVGGYPKAEIREIARQQDLPVHDKPDSQEICFIPDNDYLGFIRERRPDLGASGPLLDSDGTVLGEHTGVESFTIGQRRGLGITLGEPRYVVQIEHESRTVRVGPRTALNRVGLEATKFQWHVDAPTGPVACIAQIRTRHRPVQAMVEPMEGDRARVMFDAPQQAVTPGQVVTVYDGDLVMGGGWIEQGLDGSSEALDR